MTRTNGIASLKRAGLAVVLGLALAHAAPFVCAQEQKSEAEHQKQAHERKTSKGLRTERLEGVAAPEEIGEGPDFIRKREEWFHEQRAYPLGFIPSGARLRALEQLDTMLKAEPFGAIEGAAVPPPSGPNAAWTAIGPQATNSPFFSPFTSGRVTALVVDPSDPTGKTVYLGGAQGGVWKTTDGGANWTPLTDLQPSLAVGSIALDSSTNPSTIYVGTGEENFSADSYYGAGVLKSIDGGTTWTRDTTFLNPSPLDQFSGGPRVGAISVNPANNQILLAAVQGSGTALQSGVWRSINGGNTWTHVLPTTPRIAATDVLFDPADPGGKIAYVGITTIAQDSTLGTNGGIYKSADAGLTWTKLTLPVADSTTIGRIALAIAPSSSSTIYAAIADALTGSNRLLGAFKTTNGGTSWTQLTDPLVSPSKGFCNSQCFYDLVLKVSPTDPTVVFAGGAANNATLIRSLDGGNTWVDVSGNRGRSTTGIHVDMHAMAFAPNGNLYVGNDGGVWSTSDFKASVVSWTNLNSTLNITQFYPGHSIHPSTPAIGFGGTQDNGIQKFSGTLIWQDLGLPCDGGWTVIDTLIPSTVYGMCEYIPNFLLIIGKSFVNGDFSGNNGLLVTNGIDPSDRGNFIPPLVVDPANPQTLYFGTFRVWQTVDGGDNWTAISGDVSGAATGLSTIAVAPSDSKTVYTGSSNGHVQVSTNVAAGSATFNDISVGLPQRSVTQIAVDPTTPQTAYVTLSGFGSCSGCDGMGHVFKTTNAGIAWSSISGNLPDTPINDIVVDPDLLNTLYVATDIGVFFTIDGGSTWSPLGATNTLPRVAALSLKLHRPSRTLRAATHGRGVWDLPLGGQAAFGITSISPFTKNAGDPDFLLTVNGNGFTSNSRIQWTINGNTDTNLTTNLISPNQLTANIPRIDVQAGGAARVVVTNSGNTSNALIFTVLNPTPTITSPPSPATISLGSGQKQITINGTNFNSSSKVDWNNSTTGITTMAVSSTQITVTVAASLVNLPFGQGNDVTVVNPAPGGGPSNPALVTVAAPPPANDNFVNATVATSSTFTNTVDSSGATTEATDPVPLCAQGSDVPPIKTVWYKFTAGGSGSVTADTIGSSYDTVLLVVTGAGGNFTMVACNDDIVRGIDIQSRVTFNVTSGNTYFLMVSAFGSADPGPVGQGGKTVFNLSTAVPVGADFALTTPSGAQTVNAGQSATYTITVTAQGGAFANPVTFSCSNLPAQSSCASNPLSVTPGATSANTTLTISTTARSTVPGARPSQPRLMPWPRILVTPWLFVVALLLLAAAFAARKTKQRRATVYVPLALFFILLLLKVSGCGGGGGSMPPPPVQQGTPAGTFTITVTGTSGTTAHSTTVTLKVN